MDYSYFLLGDKKIKCLKNMVFGKDPSCQVQLQTAGKYHASVTKENGNFVLKHLEPYSKTFVNQKEIMESVLRDGDKVSIGEHILTFCSSKKITTSLFESANLKWQKQLEQLPAISKSEYPILILGASGTGKEVVAKFIHENSSRCGEFLSINCSALNETLIESELFGHKKGSFTNATHDRKGAFEQARGGTLFLDEIGDLPLSLQPKLLRAIENQEIKPVGSDKVIKTDVRIVSATHQNLNKKIFEKTFRNDLYFRLSLFTISPPALTERMEDFDSILKDLCESMKVVFCPEAVDKMKYHSWPGNIRELKNTVAKASVLFHGQQISKKHLELILEDPRKKEVVTSDTNLIKNMEKKMICETLALYGGNQRRTAEALGIPKSTLNDRIRAYRKNTELSFA